MALTRSKRQRLVLVVSAVGLLTAATLLAMTALRDNVVFFITPTEIAEGAYDPARRFRLGGLVEENSVVRDMSGAVRFNLTDGASVVTVAYNGLLPDLFREGQGIVANGTLSPHGQFTADEVLAKHDENYMPAEVVEAMKRQGFWQEDLAP